MMMKMMMMTCIYQDFTEPVKQAEVFRVDSGLCNKSKWDKAPRELLYFHPSEFFGQKALVLKPLWARLLLSLPSPHPLDQEGRG